MIYCVEDNTEIRELVVYTLQMITVLQPAALLTEKIFLRR